ncbi:hypothetical protein QTI66_36060 [Variovorax sp. J22R133]|uniref:hypothetical protein n=1 Tax=Variovorax brevis TaxID=3053503 RepID=UPI0025770C25|nr:hypothetical protein [Variovorax sp. J22R133]MDM0117531.1 hypothetical protein [Variovorax sp. J22R133]
MITLLSASITVLPLSSSNLQGTSVRLLLLRQNRDGIPTCGRAELRLRIERDCVLWESFFEGAATPTGSQLFKVVETGTNELELLIRDLHLPPQGASVQAAALGAALDVLQAHLEVSGVVHKTID